MLCKIHNIRNSTTEKIRNGMPSNHQNGIFLDSRGRFFDKFCGFPPIFIILGNYFCGDG